jgi:chromate transport protein ChrA
MRMTSHALRSIACFCVASQLGPQAWRLAIAMIATSAIVMVPMLVFAAYTDRPILRALTEAVGAAVLVIAFAMVAVLVQSPLPFVPVAIGVVGFFAVTRLWRLRTG